MLVYVVGGPILEKLGKSDKGIIIDDAVISPFSLHGDSRLGRKLCKDSDSQSGLHDAASIML